MTTSSSAASLTRTSSLSTAIPIAKLIEPVKANLTLVEELLVTNLIDDNPFVSELLNQIFQAGGKRLRPALVLLCSHATLKSQQEFSRLHIILAVLTELIHTASLVHDDVIDKASLRRGQGTLNHRFNDRIAVLMGDLLFAQASICLARIMNPVVVGIYGQVLGDLCAGELSQMKQQYIACVNWQDYIRKSVAKTASLFAAGSHSGAILNSASNDTIAALKNYGLKLGIAFQIIDDLLDFTGTSNELGKEPGGDLRSGIITAPALFVLEQQSAASKRLSHLITTRAVLHDEGTQEALELIKSNGGIDATVALAQKYGEESKNSLACLPASPYCDSLVLLVDYVLTRVT